jgi:Cytochrome C oxidase, cbb3-type, subunit III
MKRGTLLLLTALVTCGVTVILTVAILHNGMSAKATPSHLEAILAREARHLATPSSARSAANPITPSPEILKEARLHFADHCAVCHGNDGSGNTMMGRGLYPKPPDLRLADTQNLSDGELYWIIENGVRFTGMPAFSGHDTSDSSWELVSFIRHLPQQTTAERMEMERYNPKGPDDRKEEEEEDQFLNGGASEKPKGAGHTKH